MIPQAIKLVVICYVSRSRLICRELVQWRAIKSGADREGSVDAEAFAMMGGNGSLSEVLGIRQKQSGKSGWRGDGG